ncbi:MAG: adenine deaminase [Candidatus Marinimicrobia bacterium]|nr:adenine deaminase [Candidatus Neomarinimicrobiota bacterium]
MDLKNIIQIARGDGKADILFKNGRFINVFSGKIEKNNIAVKNGYIIGFGDYEAIQEIDLKGKTLLPGFIDGHVHIESSMLSPLEFGKAVVVNGTTTVVADPHEIVNVMGEKGLEYMIESSKMDFIDIFFMLPSCVPATNMETNGGKFDVEHIKKWISHERILGLAEVMNYPGVVHGDDMVLNKINAAKKKIIDGHAPYLSGKELNAYILAGIKSDHECTKKEEALEKLERGMHIMIREGSAARNLEELIKIVNIRNHTNFSFVTDDRHPDFLIDYGHINTMVRRAIDLGIDPIISVKMASFNTAQYFRLYDRGAIAPGYIADLVIIDDMEKFNIIQVYKRGKLVAENGRIAFDYKEEIPDFKNTINIKSVNIDDIRVKAESRKINVIEIIPDQIITKRAIIEVEPVNGFLTSQPESDIVKLVVVERHHATGNIGIGFVKGLGLKRGAIASTVAHDSHNIIVVGISDEDILFAIEGIKKMGGGQIVVENGKIVESLPLPIAGLMSNQPLMKLREKSDNLNKISKKLGCKIDNPFMTLSFLALPVIPEIKLTDKGLVEVTRFKFIPLFVN